MNKNLRALVVEDTRIAQTIAKIILKNLNCNIDIAETGEQAIELFQENSYDIIFMDLGLPNIDGFETTKIIRSLERNAHTTIVALTTHLEDKTKEKCLSAGMDSFMLKPLNVDNTKAIIEKIQRKI